MLSTLLVASLLASGFATPPAAPLDPDRSLTQFVLDRWSRDDGLPQHTVRSILQTEDGYLWLATQAGLVRFNGLEFSSYDSDPAFRSIATIALAQPSGGPLWVGTHDGVVLVEGLQARHLDLLPKQTHVGALAPAGQGEMWVGTWTSGLYRCSLEACRSIPAPAGADFSEVQSVTTSPDGTWIGTNRGVFRVSDGKLQLVPGSGSISVSSMAFSGTGELVIADRTGSYSIIADHQVQSLPDTQAWPSERAFSLMLDRAGALWLGLESSGIHRQVGVSTIGHGSSLDIPGTRVLAIYEDREGSVWIGTEGGGLLRLRQGAFTTIGTNSGLSTDYVTTLFEDADGSLLAGTFGAGVNRIDPATLGVVSQITGLPSQNITAVMGSDDGRLWIGSIDSGVWWIAGSASGALSGLPSQSVYALHLDRRGVLWVGTDEGLAMVSDGKTKVLTVDDGLGSNSIVDIEDDAAGNVWVGTYGGGLSRIRVDGTIKNYTTADGLGADIVSALLADEDGILWIGTIEGGIGMLANGQLEFFSMRDGLFDRTAFQILEDSFGFLWMGSNQGVTRVRKRDILEYAAGNLPLIPHEAFGSDDGLATPEINGGAQPAGWRSSDGRIWFPTGAGVALVDPSDLVRNTVRPPVVIERIEADGIALPVAGTVDLPPGTRRIEFKFAALSLVDARAISYRYRLDGREDEWSSPMDGNTASYTFLEPGSYRFQVIAANNDGLWNEEGVTLEFTLQPYFYQSPWFWMLLASIGFLAGAWYFRGRTQQLKHQREQLERMVDDRTRDVMAAKDQIQAQSDALRASLKEKDVLLREVHHRVKNNLQMISSLLQLQSRQVNDPETKLLFDECRNRIYSFSMVHERLYRAKDIAHFEFEAYLTGLAEQLVRSHANSLQEIELEVEVAPGEMDVDRAIPCGLILTEFVTNALRHAFGSGASGTISVEFSRVDGMGILTVDDDGAGLGADPPLERREGLGLKLVDALVTRLKGELQVESRNVGGTRCRIVFPLLDESHSLLSVAQTESMTL